LLFAPVLFASSNIDDLFALIGFADPKYRTRQVIIRQYIGIAVLVAVSAVASLASLVLERSHVSVLGHFLVLIGAKKLFDLRRDAARRTWSGALEPCWR
jgi:cadmium resistance protein CadD (predicted permease)